MNYFNYFSEIEETFNRRRGKFQFLSSIDWVLMEDWEKRGVPLHIVLRAIDKVFDNYDVKPNRRRSIKGLTYCREEIEAQYEEWAERQVGKNSDPETAVEEEETFGAAAVRNHIAELVEQIRDRSENSPPAFAEILTKVVYRLENLLENYSSAETAESELARLETLLDDYLLNDSEDAIRLEAEGQTAKNLAQYKTKMDAEALRRTSDLMTLKILREHYRIPRLSLFYL